jgi:hypothetical protein
MMFEQMPGQQQPRHMTADAGYGRPRHLPPMQGDGMNMVNTTSNMQAAMNVMY